MVDWGVTFVCKPDLAVGGGIFGSIGLEFRDESRVVPRGLVPRLEAQVQCYTR